jgi:hypothetical protein
MQDIPASFQPLDHRHFREISACLRDEQQALRFLALYVVSTGSVAIHTGWDVRTAGTDQAALQTCIREALADAGLEPLEGDVVVVDRGERLAWTAPANAAFDFLADTNPKPDQSSG